MLTPNCDSHPILNLMHKPEPGLPPNAQDKRTVEPLEPAGREQWLRVSIEHAL